MVGDGRLGQSVGRYRIDSVIGQGGFATVYRAVDTTLERPVALKVLDVNAQRDPTSGRRFIREGQAVASLDHPAIVPVYDAGEDEGTLWMAMRFVEGGSLHESLAAGRRFSAEETVAVVGRIAAALDHAHEQGIVHRDVKPSNILIEGTEPGSAWLTDFGIAVTARKMGHYTTGALGTAAYMAPEQARPNQAGPPADLYSLACVAYELLTGNRPFPGDDYVALLMAHATEPVTPTGNPLLDQFMARALAKEVEHRPASGQALVDGLRHVVDGSPNGAAASTVEQTAAGHAPTVVMGTDRTLVHPYMQPVPATPPASPALLPMAQPANPVPPPLPVPQSQPPSPSPGWQTPQYQYPEHRPAEPAAAQVARKQAKGRAIIGGLILIAIAAAVGATYILSEQTPPSLHLIEDNAGIRYMVPTSWEARDEERLVTFSENGVTMATVRHGPVDDTDVVESLRAEDACESAAQEGEPLGGSETLAWCTNPEGTRPAAAAGAIAYDRLWVIEVEPEAPEDALERILEHVEFSPPPAETGS